MLFLVVASEGHGEHGPAGGVVNAIVIEAPNAEKAIWSAEGRLFNWARGDTRFRAEPLANLVDGWRLYS